MSAVANAIVEAQDKVDRHQIDILRHFFDPDGRPVSVKVALPTGQPVPAGQRASPTGPIDASAKVPAGAPDRATGEDVRILSVPLLTLVPTNLLQIKEFLVSFEVELGELSLPRPAGAPGAPMAPVSAGAPLGVPQIANATADQGSRLFEPVPPSPALTVGLQASTQASKGTMARISMKLEALPQPEGIARLIQHLNRTF
jgi:hypothetical protein